MKKIDYIFVSLSFFIPFIVYLSTMAPTTSLWDCGEFIATSVIMGVPHPPGSPFYLLIGNVFSQIPIFTDIGARLNFISVFSSALSVLLLYKSILIIINDWKDYPDNQIKQLQIRVSSFIASLTFAFTYSQWYNAVEAEVYSLSIFFTSLIVWLTLKWSTQYNKKGNEKYILLLSYLVGITTGLHILNLLVIPFITLIVFYKRYYNYLSQRSKKIYFFYTVCITLVLFYTIYSIIYMGLPRFAPLANGKGLIVCVLAFLGLIVATVLSIKRNIHSLSTICTSFLLIIMGYSTYTTIIIRAKQYPSINENQPDDLIGFKKYMNRDQYGDWKILDRTEPIERPDVNSDYKKRWVADKVKIEDISMIPARYHMLKENKNDLNRNQEYNVIINHDRAIDMITKRGYESIPGLEVLSEKGMFVVENETILPKEYIQGYSVGTKDDKILSDLKNGIAVPGVTISKDATFLEGANFAISYQLYEMYIRYFLWQFAGRGNNDMEITNLDGQALEPKDGVDPLRYGIPLALILGIVGLLYHFYTDPKSALSILALFLATGLAIILYLNQYDPQPRERDYSYVGSFFAFSIWIGIGIVYIFDIIDRWLNDISISNFLSLSIVGILLIIMPIQMVANDYTTHDRSGNYVAWDYAYNLLNSCDDNAILFTNGDNDTFPLWYLQEVESIRKDVRVVNLSLLNTDWYIEQLIKQPAKVPIKFENDLDSVLYNIEKYQYVFTTIKLLRKISKTWNRLSEIIYSHTDEQLKKHPDYKNIKKKISKNYFNNPQPTIEDKKAFNAEFSHYVLDGKTWGDYEAGIPVEWSDAIYEITPKDNNKPSDVSFKLSINPTLGDSYIKVQDYMILKIVEDAFHTNPIYFAGTVPPKYRMGLDAYLQMEGLVYKLTSGTKKSNSSININLDKHIDNISNTYRYRNLNNLEFSLNQDNVRLLNNYRLSHIYNYFSNVRSAANEYLPINEHRQGEIFNSLIDMKNQIPYERFINKNSFDNSFDIQIANIHAELSNGLEKYYDQLIITDFNQYTIDSLHNYIAKPLLKSELESRKIFNLIQNKDGSYNTSDINDIASSYFDILNDPQFAIYIYNSVINKNPYNASAYVGLANIYRSINQTNHAINILETAVKKFPKNINTHLLLSEIFLYEKENPYKALEYLTKIKDNHPNKADIYKTIASIYYDIADKYVNNNELSSATEVSIKAILILEECINNTRESGCQKMHEQFFDYFESIQKNQ